MRWNPAPFVLLLAPAAAGSNNPPQTPTITEPATGGAPINPGDVHMETSPFVDPDPGDEHFCSDWEIWRFDMSERVWAAECVTGPEKLHCHLGDGSFENSHAGRTELLPTTFYKLRVRHSDDSGDAATRWSDHVELAFLTGDLQTVYPLELEDVLDPPPVRWTLAAGGADIVLPGGATPPSLRLESSHGDLLLEIEGLDGAQNAVTNPPPVHHDPVKVIAFGGSGGLALGASDLALYDDSCSKQVLLLPALALAPGETKYMWVSTTGASFHATASQTEPDFSTPLRRLDPPWHPRRPGFRVEVFAQGFQLPTNIAFVPDPGPAPSDVFFYVTELYGRIKTVLRDGTTLVYADDLLNFDPSGNFPGSGEMGVAGLVVEPASGDLIATMVYQSGSTLLSKVVRYSSLDGGRTAAGETILLDLVNEPMSQSHQISHVSFGPDGKLYVHVGDGFQAGKAQDLSSLRGKILRLEPDGSPCVDNPFYDATDGLTARDHVYAYGFRNPFGGDWRDVDGRLYEVENGPGIDRFAKVLPGQNYGWNGTNQSMGTGALYNWIPAHAPVNLAFVQRGSFGGSGFPPHLFGHAFVSESGPTHSSGPQANGKRVSEWILDAAGNLVAGPIPFLEYAGYGKSTACGLAAGPDGLYMTELYADNATNPTATGARVLRIWYDASIDCNGNGTDDACDIASGASADLNQNQLPDECECVDVSFCQSLPNSTGGAATLSSNGECVVAANALALTASPVPNEVGYFFFGDQRVNGGAGLPFLNGFRCVGGGAVHRLGLVLASGNVAAASVDLTNPQSGGAISAGSTWHFQYWFRDPSIGGAGIGLSDGLTIAFQ